MEKKILACGIGLVLVCWGCIGDRFEFQEDGGFTNAPSMRTVSPELPKARADKDAGPVPEGFGKMEKAGSRTPRVTDRDAEVADGSASDSDGVDDTEPLPNGIFIATCESEPNEVAVPLNALDDRYCDTVQAVAYRSDDEGSYPVSAIYTWSVGDKTIADIYSVPGKEHSGVQRPSVMYDLFSTADGIFEPETSVKVCVTPLVGWPDANQAPLCRTLPLRAVVNLDGAWCFSGTTFDGQCDARLIVQDGRELLVDHDGVGAINMRHVYFHKEPWLYEGILDASWRMHGIVTRMDVDHPEMVGEWQAEHMAP